MSLAFILTITATCVGFAALVHAVVKAPEGNEGDNGFSYKLRTRKARSFLKTEVALKPTVHVHRITAA